MIHIPPTLEDIKHIKQSYVDVVKEFKFQNADKKNLYLIQEALNNNARRIYDKHGRIILKVGENEYLDITSPRASFHKDKVLVSFMETDREGHIK
jgi:hypothetical protein